MRAVRVAVMLAALLVGLLPGAALGAEAAPIHVPYASSGPYDLCGVPVTYQSNGLFTLVYNAQTNSVTAVDHSTTSFTAPNGKILVWQGGSLQLITNVVNPDGSQSYTWTLPGRTQIKLADGGVLAITAGIAKYAATVYPDGTIDFRVTLEAGPRIDWGTLCDKIVRALTT